MAIWHKILRVLHLRRTRQPDREQSSSPLQHRDQVIRLITNHLEENSLVCFAIACPEFHDEYFPLSIAEQRRIDVRLGSRPFSDYFCRGCDANHPSQTYWFGAQFFTCNDFYGRHLSPQDLQTSAFDFSLSVPKEIAHKVMHHHLTGFAHDFPVEQLVPRGPLITWHYDVRCIRSWEARIVANQLVLHSQVTLTFENDRSGAGQYIDMGLISICRHVNTGRLLLLNQVPPLENYFSRRHGPVTSCVVCNTDYAIDIIWDGEHWVVGISSYHILETVRPPTRWTWDVMSYCPKEAHTSPRFRELQKIPPGIAMRMWHKQDTMALDWRPEGEWAVQPANRRDRNYVNRPVLLI